MTERLPAGTSEAVPPEDRPPLTSGPKRQHFLPRFYLEGFARDGFVAVYDRQENEVRRQQPKDTAVIGHFYTLRDGEGRRRFELEALLSEYESKAAPAIRKLAAREELTADERTDLAIFIALAAMRTPEQLDSLKQAQADFIWRIADMTHADPAQLARSLAERPENAHLSGDELREQAERMAELVRERRLTVEVNHQHTLGTAMSLAFKVAPILAGRDWTVVHSRNEAKSFVTSDAPVILTTSGPRKNTFYGVGFANADAVVIMPLTATCALMIHDASGALRHVTCKDEFVNDNNDAVARSCQRFVIGRDPELLQSIARRTRLAKTKWRPKFRVG